MENCKKGDAFSAFSDMRVISSSFRLLLFFEDTSSVLLRNNATRIRMYMVSKAIPYQYS